MFDVPRRLHLSDTDKAPLLLRLARYGDFGTRAQHGAPLQFEYEPCHHNLRDSITLRRASVNPPPRAPEPTDQKPSDQHPVYRDVLQQSKLG